MSSKLMSLPATFKLSLKYVWVVANTLAYNVKDLFTIEIDFMLLFPYVMDNRLECFVHSRLIFFETTSFGNDI